MTQSRLAADRIAQCTNAVGTGRGSTFEPERIPAGWKITPLKHTALINTEVLSEKTAPNYELEYVDISNVDERGGVVQVQTLAFEDAPISDRMVEQSVIFYGNLCERAGVPFLTHGVGRFLGEIAEWCEENGWPPLNSLAVNRGTGMPGIGYDGAPGSDLLHWPEQVRRCIAFAGYPETVAD